MRKYACILLASLIFSKITYAQTDQVYKPFKIAIGMGATGQPFDVSGLLLFAEPSFTLGDRFKPGLRFEYVFLDMKNIGSSALTFDYYFITTHSFRFFAGGGYSLYTTSSTGGCSTGSVTEQNLSTTKKPGAMARLGFDVDHFHLSVEYNFIPTTYFNSAGNTDQTAPTVLYKNSYFALKFGVTIGGGKKTIIK